MSAAGDPVGAPAATIPVVPLLPRDLLEREKLASVEEAVVAAEDLLRHAVDAAEVAAVGDRDAQVAQRPGQRVGDGIHVCSLPVHRLRHTP